MALTIQRMKLCVHVLFRFVMGVFDLHFMLRLVPYVITAI